MRSIVRTSVVVFTSLIVACSGETLQSQTRSIVNGQTDSGHPAVGVLQSSNGVIGGNCTATLITSTKVLTAAHCVLDESNNLWPRVEFYIGGLRGAMYLAKGIAVHPQYAGGNQSDLAVVELDQSVTGVAPVALPTRVPTRGETVTLVGYGLTGAQTGQFGTKRRATTTIYAVDPTLIAFDGQAGSAPSICNGDSGGPTLATRSGQEEVIGVHSTGDCSEIGIDMRVDVFTDWITTQQVTRRTYGWQCADGGGCLSGLCVPNDQISYCTQACDDTACPGNDSCQAVTGAPNGITKVCIPHSGSYKKLGEACTRNDECQTYICQQVPGEGQLCSQLCDTAKQDCPDNFDCAPTTAGGGLCIPTSQPPPPPPPPPPPEKKKLGEACDSGSDCQSNLCATLSQGKRCIELCDPTTAQSSCPDGYVCQAAQGGTGACVEKPKAGLGEACSEHSDCASSLCAAEGDKKFCTERCAPATGCATGFECVAVGSDNLCLAEAGAGGGGGGCSIGYHYRRDPPAGGPRSPAPVDTRFDWFWAWAGLALLVLRTRRRR